MVTIKDVAIDAGVSVGTVSNVINNLPVKADTEKRVKESIQKLGYQVNTYARGLKSKQTYTVAVIVPDLINPFFALLVNYIEQSLAHCGYKLLLCNSYGDITRECDYFNMAKQNKVDGLIALTYNISEKEIRNTNLPIVSIDRHFVHAPCCISGDNAEGGKLAALKLIETGCKRVVYIRNGSNLEGETLKRGKAFMDTCALYNIEAVRMDFGEETTLSDIQIEKINQFLEQCVSAEGFLYDGIFTSSDIHAVTIIKKLAKLGIRVPEEVQVIGYDGLRLLNTGDYVVSSIAQPVKEIAEASVENIIKIINNEPVRKEIILPVKFAEGGTTR